MKQKGLSKGELQSVKAAVGIANLINTKAKQYNKLIIFTGGGLFYYALYVTVICRVALLLLFCTTTLGQSLAEHGLRFIFSVSEIILAQFFSLEYRTSKSDLLCKTSQRLVPFAFLRLLFITDTHFQ